MTTIDWLSCFSSKFVESIQLIFSLNSVVSAWFMDEFKLKIIVEIINTNYICHPQLGFGGIFNYEALINFNIYRWWRSKFLNVEILSYTKVSFLVFCFVQYTSVSDTQLFIDATLSHQKQHSIFPRTAVFSPQWFFSNFEFSYPVRSLQCT